MYGASPRALAKYTRAEEEYKRKVLQEVARVQPDSLQHALLSPDFEISHLLTIIEPSPKSRSGYEKRVASRWIFERLFDRCIGTAVFEMKDFYDLFHQNSTTASAAGWLFELRMHQVLRRRGYPLKLFPVHGHTGQANYIYSDYSASSERRHQTTLQLTGLEEYPLCNGIELEVGRYYRPESPNPPSFDSLFLVKPQNQPFHILLIIQIAEDKTKLDVNEDDLQIIDGLGLPVQTRTCYVIVTPRGMEPHITVPRSRSLDQGQEGDQGENGQEKGETADAVFPVYHHPVDLREIFRSPQY